MGRHSIYSIYNRTLKYVFLSGILLIRCSIIDSGRHVIILNGKYKIISRVIDNSLADSVEVFGKVVSVIDTIPERHSRIWISELTKKAYSDNNGRYILKMKSGTYILNCGYLGTDEFKETTKGITFLPNEKVEIDFYIGIKIE